MLRDLIYTYNVDRTGTSRARHEVGGSLDVRYIGTWHYGTRKRDFTRDNRTRPHAARPGFPRRDSLLIRFANLRATRDKAALVALKVARNVRRSLISALIRLLRVLGALVITVVVHRCFTVLIPLARVTDHLLPPCRARQTRVEFRRKVVARRTH